MRARCECEFIRVCQLMLEILSSVQVKRVRKAVNLVSYYCKFFVIDEAC